MAILYIEKVLVRFNIKGAKLVGFSLSDHFKLSKKSYPFSNEETKKMESIPYSSAIGILMYVLICTRLDIIYAVEVGSRFFFNILF